MKTRNIAIVACVCILGLILCGCASQKQTDNSTVPNNVKVVLVTGTESDDTIIDREDITIIEKDGSYDLSGYENATRLLIKQDDKLLAEYGPPLNMKSISVDDVYAIVRRENK